MVLFYFFSLIFWSEDQTLGSCLLRLQRTKPEVDTRDSTYFFFEIKGLFTVLPGLETQEESTANPKGLRLKHSGSLSSSTSFSPSIYKRNRRKLYFIESLEYLIIVVRIVKIFLICTIFFQPNWFLSILLLI